MERLSGKTALITGGNSGIGLATAKLFAVEGARVAITGRDAKRLEDAKRELGDVLAIQSDTADLAQISALMQEVEHSFHRLDVLFVNAGLSHAAPLELVTEGQFDQLIAVNFKGAFFTIQKALPLLRKGSSVIVTTSIAHLTGTPLVSVYAACKAAQHSLIRSLALELIPRGIRLNGLCPGPIETPMYGKLGLSKEAEAGWKATVSAKSPIQRFGDALEVARVALFLASADSSYIVGEEIVVDGAMSLL
jgi:NAD(P)-dependent dehydrogenase (short-subunit alcohol dehydrogenase family)